MPGKIFQKSLKEQRLNGDPEWNKPRQILSALRLRSGPQDDTIFTFFV
jgi:hypothetical protein